MSVDTSTYAPTTQGGERVRLSQGAQGQDLAQEQLEVIHSRLADELSENGYLKEAFSQQIKSQEIIGKLYRQFTFGAKNDSRDGADPMFTDAISYSLDGTVMYLDNVSVLDSIHRALSLICAKTHTHSARRQGIMMIGEQSPLSWKISIMRCMSLLVDPKGMSWSVPKSSDGKLLLSKLNIPQFYCMWKYMNCTNHIRVYKSEINRFKATSPESVKKLITESLEEDKLIPRAIFAQFLITTCEKVYSVIESKLEETIFLAVASPNEIVTASLRRQNISSKGKDGKVVKRQVVIWPFDRFQSARENHPNKELVCSSLPFIKSTLSSLGFDPACKDAQKRSNAVTEVNQLIAFLYNYADRLAGKQEIISEDIDYIFDVINSMLQRHKDVLKDTLEIERSIKEKQGQIVSDSLFKMPDSVKDIQPISLSQKVRNESQIPQRKISEVQTKLNQEIQQKERKEVKFVPPYLYDNDGLAYFNCPSGVIGQATRMTRKEALEAFLKGTKDVRKVKTNVYLIDIGSVLSDS